MEGSDHPSMEETMRDAAAGGRAAFDLAAEIAREVAADASLRLQVAQSSLSTAVREEFGKSERSDLIDGIHQAVRELRGQVVTGFATAAAVADRRALTIRDVILGMTEIEMAQVDILEATWLEFSRSRPRRRSRRRRA